LPKLGRGYLSRAKDEVAVITNQAVPD